MKRRRFLEMTGTGLAAAALAPLGCATRKEESTSSSRWPIGCFNRPWAGDKRSYGYDAALDGIQAAGYHYTGLLTRSAKEPFIGSDATPEYLVELKRKIAAHHLKVTMAAVRTKDELPLEAQIKDMRQQIDNGKTVGAEYLLTFGVNKAEHFANYYALMHDAAGYAREHGMKVVLKPHGGASGASEEIMRCIEKVKHENFKIWFDAGNIIYYTGKDPLEQLKPIAQHVTGFCAKDCDKQKGNVWLEFGTGKVDFAAVFGELKRVGFHGPVMVECCALADTPEGITANARKNREYLEQLFASL